MTDLEKEILRNAMRFCAYRERCNAELMAKMRSWEVSDEITQKIVAFLKEEKYLSDERYAISFTRGKFLNNFWGKQKIKRALQEKQIAAAYISDALEALSQEDYESKLKELIDIKNRSVKAKNVFERRKKIADFLMRKGYEGSLVWDTLKELIPDE